MNYTVPFLSPLILRLTETLWMIDSGIFQRELDSVWLKLDVLYSKPF